jgi:hypothetical protein
MKRSVVMMRNWTAVALMLWLAAACSRAEAEGDRMDKADDRGVELSWTLKRDPDGRQLQIDYRLTNRSGGDIYVADRMLAYHEGKTRLVLERVVVTAGDQPDTVRFVRGIVDTGTTRYDHPPGAYQVAAGATHVGSAVVPLPLRGWHNYAGPPRIPEAPARAQLEIAYLKGEGIEWGRVTTSDGTEVAVPQLPSYHRFARLAVGQSKPLPGGASR